MKIKRLDIIGFKSFVDRVTLDFPDGITAVVGPNGCGKSNIVDAIRWVMGEQSAKNLRGRNMEDVIFGGCESRKPLGMAEVSLVFSTDDKLVPAKYLNFSEIQVTRRLYRDGESEYLLNKTTCRLMDIAELFMDTGIGARAYSIIEQGRIGMILLSKPEERRFLIEEAAGVTKYKARKQVALKKIELSRQNLVRLGDIISELKRQLTSLQRQAKKAEKFRMYREELKEIDISFCMTSFHALAEQREQLAQSLASLEQMAVLAQAEANAAELALEEKRIVLAQQETCVSAAQENLYRCRSDIQATDSRLQFLRKDLGALQLRKDRLSQDLANLHKQLQESETERLSLDSVRNFLVAELSESNKALVDGERNFEELAKAERGISAQLDETRRHLFGLLSEITHLSNLQTAAARRLDSLRERSERNRREKVSLEQKASEIADHRTRLLESCQALTDRKRELEEEYSSSRSREVELKEAVEFTERNLLVIRDELSKKRSRLHSLQELEAQYAGYGQGVRTLLLSEAFRGRFPGVVADFIEIDQEYETALEAVLGEKLQYVITDGDGDALTAITFLKEITGGRCSFVPQALTAVVAQEPLPLLQPLLNKVMIPSGFDGVIATLLSETFLAEDLAQALSFARRYPRLTFVTMQGDVVCTGGIVNGGSTEGNQHGLVHKKREIKELDRQVRTLSGEVLGHEKAKEQLKNEIEAAEETLRTLRQKLHTTDIELVNCNKDIQRAGEEAQGIVERLAVKAMEDDQLNEEGDGLRQEIEVARQKAGEGEERRAGLEKEVTTLNDRLSAQKDQIEQARDIVTGMKVKTAELKEKLESNLAAINRLQRLSTDVDARIAGHVIEAAQCVEDEQLQATALAADEEKLKQLQKLLADAETAFGASRQKYETSASVLLQAEAHLKDLRIKVEQARLSLSEQTALHAELTLKIQILENSMMDRYRVSIASLISEYQGPDHDEADRRARRDELQKLVDEIGEVNLTAIDEYRELEERFSFLTSQKEDLEDSLQSLQKAIQRINKTTRKRFLETFHQVNAQFKEVFPRLFCGGCAELRLTNEEDLLETGIDIIVQPPGKKLQNVSLLSGGEKALTAVALIFSIFLIKPSPFCLLDEVDAPLDDANIGRFNEMVREMTAFSQFIVITHNKATMAVADTLFGVTMEEPGVSKLVSVKLN